MIIYIGGHGGGLGGVRPPLEDFAYVVNSDVRGGRYYIRPPPCGLDPRHAHIWSEVINKP